MKPIELLLPAQNFEFGKTAFQHGADAVYIGAPKFGARQAAGNSIADIEQLCREAHFWGGKVYVTLNTLLFDHELDEATSMAWALYRAGADALIIQDLGLLGCDLPPIPLHASTQTHITTAEKAQFLQACGFTRLILARELSLPEIAAIKQATNIELEAFVHGSLCVCYSGQCYMSLKLTDRSGNRGACAQVCRSRYDLLDENGEILLKNKHLLSLKDMNRAAFLPELLAAGIQSLKIEGRLKDLSYVKNITAFYRQKLDALLDGNAYFRKASTGKTTFTFEPNPAKTFNRDYTDYFLNDERTKIASMETPKSIGEFVGYLKSDSYGNLLYEGDAELHVGDGLCFWQKTADSNDVALEGFFVNQIDRARLKGSRKIAPTAKTALYRNYNHLFEKQLKNPQTAARKIDVDINVKEEPNQLIFSILDEDGVAASTTLSVEKQVANEPQKVLAQRQQTLSKLGQTNFQLRHYREETKSVYFIPNSALNKVKNALIEQLVSARRDHFRPIAHARTEQPRRYPYQIDALTNITNAKAAELYRKSGAEPSVLGIDATKDFIGQPLMTCRYCLRFELGQCPKCHPRADLRGQRPLFLRDNHRRYRLVFDCQHCRMLVFGEGD